MDDQTTEQTIPLPIPARPGRPLDPAARRRRAIAEEAIDQPVILADGNAWWLARTGLAPILDEVRDRLYGDSVVLGEVRMSDVIQAAWVALLANYDLADDELAALLTGLSEEQERKLVQYVTDAVFGPSDAGLSRGYSDWARASLLANGLDPAAIPALALPDVLDILVRTGRTVPESDWIAAAVAAGKRSKLLQINQQIEESNREARQRSSRPTGHSAPMSFGMQAQPRATPADAAPPADQPAEAGG